MRTRGHSNVFPVIAILLISIAAASFAEKRVVPRQPKTGKILANKKAFAGKYPLPDIEITPKLTAQQLWQAFLSEPLPAGITMHSITYTGTDSASGSYKYLPPLVGVQLKDGIVLTSGSANDVKGPNWTGSTSIDNGAPGDADLLAAAAIPQAESFNASVFTIEFTSDTSIKGVSFDFAYGTDEFPEYVNSEFNDVFCAFLDKKNIAFDTLGKLISVNNNFFKINNNIGTNTLNLQYDGFTLALRTSAAIAAGRHTLKFAVCDIGDNAWDAGVFLSNFRFKVGPIGTHPITNFFDDQTFSVLENSPGGTFVGKLKTTLADTSKLKFSLLTAVPQFALDGNKGILTVANGANLDYETQNKYVFPVRAIYKDSFPDTANITVNILNIDWGDLIADQTFSVLEHSPAGTLVGTVQVLLPDSLPVTVSQLQGVPEFTFDQTTRRITVANGAVLDVDIQDRYYIKLVAKAKEAKDDTATMTIIIVGQNKISIDKAFYYDNTADGYVDSIYATVTTNINPLTGSHVQGIIDNAITLPAFRGFTVAGSGVATGGFFIKVAENKGHTPVTYITQDDKLTVKGYVFPTGEEVAAGTVTVYDRVAPIIHWAPRSALLRDYRVTGKSDTLGVKFSEAVKDVSSNEPFYFLNHTNNANYVVTLSAAGHPQPDSLVFHVASVAGMMQDGDSLWIHETNRIADDTAGNFQNNPLNIKRRLYVDIIYALITIECGYYFDNNADGYVDSVYVKATTDIEGGLTDARVAEIVQKAIILPAFRDFTVNSSGVADGGFFIKVTENKAHNPYTYITNDDKLIVSACVLSMGGEVSGGTLPMYDRVAPLIHWEAWAAYLVDYMDSTKADTLSVKFSEPITGITADEPFLLLRVEGNKQYSARLAPVSLDTDKKIMRFTVQSLDNNMEKMRDGDSIWIQQTNRVGDGVTPVNYQNNNNNTRRRLYVTRISMPYEYIPQAVSPLSYQSMLAVNTIPDEITAVLGSELPNLNLQKNPTGQYCGMIIMVVPDPEDIGQFNHELKVEGTMTILDAVGNTLVLKQPLSWWENRKSLVTVWNLKNRNGRIVGPGMYVCLFDIVDVTDKNNPKKQVKKITIGVK